MATHSSNSNIFITIFIFIFIFSLLLGGESSSQQPFSRKVSKESLGLKHENLSHLHFYFHDTASGRQPSVVRVAASPTTNTSSTFFGRVSVSDDPLTVGPDPSSKQVGRAQGLYTTAAIDDIVLILVYTFVFTEGEFNGSSISILGRFDQTVAVNEMPIVGGSGVLRYARGYASPKIISYNTTTEDAVTEYNVYVFHY